MTTSEAWWWVAGFTATIPWVCLIAVAIANFVVWLDE